ncbi:MAG TPA: hypothetical protein VMK65_07715 [Longimicrobiales bacterium]|nr:hypothetical protein [Longimicrobiales bacterium]
MSHLNDEDLARLVDEAPAPAEAAHLDGCGECRDTWELLRRQTTELSALPPLAPPAGEWQAVEARLRAEGLIRAAPRAAGGSGVLRIAASVAIFALGGLMGFAARGATSPSAAPADSIRASAPATRPSTQDAAARVLAAEADYLEALAAYNRSAGSAGGSPGDIVARLAALQSIVLTTGAALNEAPADPVINGYHFTALAQRDAVLRQMAYGDEDSWF